MIYFDIQDFGDCQGSVWLASSIDNERSIIRLSLDAESVAVAAIKDQVAAKTWRSQNLFVEQSSAVRWCGPGQVRNFIYAVRRALLVEGWEYFVNLSGACFPTRPLDDLFELLIEGDSYRGKSLISFFQVRTRPSVLDVLEASEIVSVSEGRLHLKGERNYIDYILSPQRFPVINVANRQFVRCFEPNERREPLHVYQPARAEVEYLNDFFSRTQLCAGRAWYALTRDFCEKLIGYLDSNSSTELQQVFLNSFEPDETFLPTLAWSGAICDKDLLLNVSLHYNFGAPERFSAVSDLSKENLRNTFFARKISGVETRQAAKALQEVRRL